MFTQKMLLLVTMLRCTNSSGSVCSIARCLHQQQCSTSLYCMLPLCATILKETYLYACLLRAIHVAPRTLPSNLSLCVNPDFKYVRVQDPATGRTYIVAEVRRLTPDVLRHRHCACIVCCLLSMLDLRARHHIDSSTSPKLVAAMSSAEDHWHELQ